MIELLLTIVIFLILGYIIKLIIGQLGLPAGIANILYAILGLIGLIYLLNISGIYTFNL